jgi:hypothetical protein
VLAAGLLASGCASLPYSRSCSAERPESLRLREGEQQIEIGRRCWVINVLGNVLSIPSKVILLNYKVDSHWISSNTVNRLRCYLADNELNDVKVRVNEYAPGGEWSRLFRNKHVGWLWRYTAGIYSVLYYTVLPGRLFGGDNYNPYTDTVNIYSDLPAVALHEAGHAKDVAGRKYRGLYAVIRILPLVPLYHEWLATGDAIAYLSDSKLPRTQRSAYRILYPAYCTYIGDQVTTYYPGLGYLVKLGAVVPGHIAGQVRALFVKVDPAVRKDPMPAVKHEECVGGDGTAR